MEEKKIPNEIVAAVANLNFYRNLYYTEPADTERGRVARDINTILPILSEFLGLED